MAALALRASSRWLTRLLVEVSAEFAQEHERFEVASPPRPLERFGQVFEHHDRWKDCTKYIPGRVFRDIPDEMLTCIPLQEPSVLRDDRLGKLPRRIVVENVRERRFLGLEMPAERWHVTPAIQNRLDGQETQRPEGAELDDRRDSGFVAARFLNHPPDPSEKVTWP